MNLIYRKIQPTWIIHQQTHTFSHIIKRPMTLLQKIYIYRFFFFLETILASPSKYFRSPKIVHNFTLSSLCRQFLIFERWDKRTLSSSWIVFFVVVSSSLQLFLSQPLSLSHYVNNRKHGGMADTNSYCPWIQTDTGFSRHIPHFVLENQWRISLAMEAYSTTSSSLSVSLTILQNTVFFIVKTNSFCTYSYMCFEWGGASWFKKKKILSSGKMIYTGTAHIYPVYTVHLEKSIYYTKHKVFYVAKVIYTGTGTCTVIQTYSKHAYIELML